MAKQKIRYRAGDVFKVPSSSGATYIGQVVDDTKPDIGAAFCYFYGKDGDVSSTNIISASFVTPDLIERGAWEITGYQVVPDHPARRKLVDARENAFVGAVVVGSGLVAEYLDTFYGVIDEHHWPDPRYFRRFFLSYPDDPRKAG